MEDRNAIIERIIDKIRKIDRMWLLRQIEKAIDNLTKEG